MFLPSLQEVAVTVSRVESNWSPTHHRSLFHVITDVWNGIKTLTDVVRPEPHTKSAIAPRPHMTIGERMRRVISSLSLSLVVNLENAACHAAVDCSTKSVNDIHVVLRPILISSVLNSICRDCSFFHLHVHTMYKCMCTLLASVLCTCISTYYSSTYMYIHVHSTKYSVSCSHVRTHTRTHTHTHSHTCAHTHSISLVLQTSHCQLRDQALVADTYELGVVFDKHKIVTMENLKAVFPREGGAGEAERKKTKNMELDSNPAV